MKIGSFLKRLALHPVILERAVPKGMSRDEKADKCGGVHIQARLSVEVVSYCGSYIQRFSVFVSSDKESGRAGAEDGFCKLASAFRAPELRWFSCVMPASEDGTLAFQ